MATAARLCETLRDPAYAQRYAEFSAKIDWNDEQSVLDTRLLPDPGVTRPLGDVRAPP